MYPIGIPGIPVCTVSFKFLGFTSFLSLPSQCSGALELDSPCSAFGKADVTASCVWQGCQALKKALLRVPALPEERSAFPHPLSAQAPLAVSLQTGAHLQWTHICQYTVVLVRKQSMSAILCFTEPKQSPNVIVM